MAGFLLLAVIFQFLFTKSEQATKYFETYYDSYPIDNHNRNAIKLEEYKWPNGVVPFQIGEGFTAEQISTILDSIKIFPLNSCVRFVPRSIQHVEHIKFAKSSSCGAKLGYRRNMREPSIVEMSDYCLNIPAAIQHELFHVLGIMHEQSRPDRDQYVDILWDNIEPVYQQNFVKAPESVVETFGLPYDYKSLMHYPKNAFAKSANKPTMVAKTDPSMDLGQQNAPTELDFDKLRKMYKCK